MCIGSAFAFPADSHRAAGYSAAALVVERTQVGGHFREGRIQLRGVGVGRGEVHRAFGIECIFARDHFAADEIDLFFPKKKFEVHALHRHRLVDDAGGANAQESIQRAWPSTNRALCSELTRCLAQRAPEQTCQRIEFLDIRSDVRQKWRL